LPWKIFPKHPVVSCHIQWQWSILSLSFILVLYSYHISVAFVLAFHVANNTSTMDVNGTGCQLWLYDHFMVALYDWFSSVEFLIFFGCGVYVLPQLNCPFCNQHVEKYLVPVRVINARVNKLHNFTCLQIHIL
jgi:hypothetical protein